MIGCRGLVAPNSIGTSATLHGPDSPGVDRVQHNERHFMMNGTQGWLSGGMWVWKVVGILIVVLLVVMVARLFKK